MGKKGAKKHLFGKINFYVGMRSTLIIHTCGLSKKIQVNYIVEWSEVIHGTEKERGL
jgi:hypothetical protein